MRSVAGRDAAVLVRRTALSRPEQVYRHFRDARATAAFALMAAYARVIRHVSTGHDVQYMQAAVRSCRPTDMCNCRFCSFMVLEVECAFHLSIPFARAEHHKRSLIPSRGREPAVGVQYKLKYCLDKM